MSEAQVHVFEEVVLGRTAELLWEVTGSQIDAFAQLSGDFNPLHVDSEYARSLGFEDRVAHGLLLGSKVSALVGMILPGRNALLLEVQLSWPAPIYPRDRIGLSCKVVDRSEEQQVVRLKLRATKHQGDRPVVVGRGWALCRIRS